MPCLCSTQGCWLKRIQLSFKHIPLKMFKTNKSAAEMSRNAHNSPLGSQRFVENVGEDNTLIKYTFRLSKRHTTNTGQSDVWRTTQPLGALVWKHSLWHVVLPDLYSYAVRWQLADGRTKCVVSRHIT